MALDPSLITNAMANWQQPAAFDPISQFAKLQTLKNGIAQQAIQQQALESGALDLQTKRQTFQDQQALDAAWKGAITTDPNTGAVTYDRSKVLSNVPGHLAPGIQQTLTGMDEAKAKLDKAQTDATSAKNELIAEPLLYVKDQGYSPEAFDAALTHAVGTGAIPAPQALQLKTRLGPNPTPQAIQAVVDPLLSTPGVQKIVTERQTAQAAADRADAAKQTATLAKEKERLARVDKAKQALGAATDQPSLDQAFKNVVAAGATPDEVAQLPRMYSPAGMDQFNRGLQTAEQRAQADQAAANAKQQKSYQDAELRNANARLAVEQQRLKNEQSVQGVFAGMPAADRGRAETAYSKDTKDYTDSVAAARGVQQLIAQAQGGNKAAPGLIPIAELRQYVNRINATELKNVSTNAGSALDRIEGYLKGATEGQPIPSDVLQATAAVSQAQEALSKQKYLARLATNKAAFGASPPPIDISGIYDAPPGGAGKISVTAPDGSVHPFDTQAQADAFKKLAGIK